MLELFVPTIIDDKPQFDGVTLAIVRDYFNQYRKRALRVRPSKGFRFIMLRVQIQHGTGSISWLIRRHCYLF